MAKNTTTTKEYSIRAPIVTVMGHVDHGKTSILDAIRKTNIVDKEYGGITQHIGAYQVSFKNKKITFIDTPGHQAFTQMRARGGRAADIVVLVVAGTEGVMPQTKEAISHAKAANVPIIVAINKSDLPGSDSKKVTQQLSQENVLTEAWGGDVISVEVSAKTGKGLDSLLESILTVAEMAELKCDPKGELEAVIIESRLDRQRGVVVSAIIKNGELKVGDMVVASGFKGKVRSLTNDKAQAVKVALPSDVVEILGFSKVPSVGDTIVYQGSDLEELSVDDNKVEIIGKNAKKTVAVVLKSDTQGTLEAVKASLANLVTSSVGATYALKFLMCATGDVTDSDVALAQSAKGIVVGFDVKVPTAIADYAAANKVPVRTYKTIYELIDDAQAILEGTASLEESKIKGRAQIIKIFKLESGDAILGCKVIAGAIKETSKVAIYEKNPVDLTPLDMPLYHGAVKKLKKGKDDVTVVGRDNDCGVLLKPQFDGAVVGLWLEVK